MSGILRQSLRFAVVGMINTSVGLAIIFALMFFMKIGPAVANALGYVIGLLISFALNRMWTFQSSRSLAEVLPKYVALAVACYFLNLGIVMGAVSKFNCNAYLAQLLGIFFYTVCMFLGCRWLVFAPRQSLDAGV